VIGEIFSHYRIVEKLGEGGMGVVYMAHDTRLDRTVALKFLPANITLSAEEIARFGQEAKAISALNHPNIATIFDIDESAGKKFLVLEFIPGGTLKSRIKQLRTDDRELSVQELTDYGTQMAEGLAHAHRHHIVHRDVKSDNIMLTEEGRVKITDFGLAKLRGASELTKTGSTIGTLAYMAPEQLRGEEIDHRADLFSLGVVLYEMATTRLPFRGEHEAALTYSIAHENPVPASTLRKNLPRELEQVISKCLQKDRALRYQEADEIVADLRRFREENSGTVKTVIVRERPRLPWLITASLALIAVLGIWLFGPLSPRGAADGRTIAVMPFSNSSEGTEYLSDGITEALINNLSRLPNLTVKSRSSVFRYKGKEIDAKSVGKELGVGALLIGNVTQRGDDLHISAELIDVGNDSHLWGEQYNRKMTDILAIQGEISREISRRLELELSGEDQALLAKKTTENSEAYRLYLQGRYQWNKRTLDGMEQSIDYFTQAVAQDPNFALAYAGLADAYAILAESNVLPAKEVMPRAEIASKKALAIDSTLAEAHASLGWVNLTHDWDWQASERELKRSIELNPKYPVARLWYGNYLMLSGRSAEAVAEVRRAIDIEPVSLVSNAGLGSVFYYSRRYDEAIEQCRKTLALDPNFVAAHTILGLSYLRKQRVDEAIDELQTALTLSEGNTNELAALGYAYGVAGKKALAKKTLGQLEERSGETYVQPMWLAAVHLSLGEKDEAFGEMQDAFRDRSGWVVFLNVDPLFDGVRNDPRFTTLLSRVGFLVE